VAELAAHPAGHLIVDGEKWLGREKGGQYCRRGEAGRL
jgi:hypothetical protein